MTVEHLHRGPRGKAELAAAVAADIPAGAYVNLGIGLPTLVANHLPRHREVILHSENGVLGQWSAAEPGQEDWDLINAGKEAIRLEQGAAFFHHADAFGMMRGGHLDICVLGAFQVSEHGDLANWHTGAPDAIPAVGGAMDLAVGARLSWVMMNLFTKDGSPKLVRECRLPLTGVGCVSRIYSEFAIIDVGRDAEGAPVTPRVLETFGIGFEELQERLGVALLDATGGSGS